VWYYSSLNDIILTSGLCDPAGMAGVAAVNSFIGSLSHRRCDHGSMSSDAPVLNVEHCDMRHLYVSHNVALIFNCLAASARSSILFAASYAPKRRTSASNFSSGLGVTCSPSELRVANLGVGFVLDSYGFPYKAPPREVIGVLSCHTRGRPNVA
jgi:hypothetical protein